MLQPLRGLLPLRDADAPPNTGVFSEESFRRLKAIMHMRKINAGKPLYAEGEPADKLFYLETGTAISIKKPMGSSGPQTPYTLDMYRAGDLFGQFEPYRQAPCSLGAEAYTDCRVGILLQRELEELLCTHATLAIEFMKWLGGMHRQTQAQFRSLMAQPV